MSGTKNARPTGKRPGASKSAAPSAKSAVTTKASQKTISPSVAAATSAAPKPEFEVAALPKAPSEPTVAAPAAPPPAPVRSKAEPEPTPQAAPVPRPAKSPELKPAAKAATEAAANGSHSAYPDLAALGRDNVAAMARANAALVKGIEELGQEVAGFAQHSLVSAVDAARALVGVRTVADLVALHRTMAQATLEGMMANSARMSEIGIRVATEALGPLNERVAVAFERFSRSAR